MPFLLLYSAGTATTPIIAIAAVAAWEKPNGARHENKTTQIMNTWWHLPVKYVATANERLRCTNKSKNLCNVVKCVYDLHRISGVNT